jgi:hypothetical protein
MSIVVAHVASRTRNILVLLGRMAEAMGYALHKPLDNLSVDSLHIGTDSSSSPLTELEPAPKDSRAFITKRPGNSPEIPETPIIALEKMRREEDDHSEDGNTLSYA